MRVTRSLNLFVWLFLDKNRTFIEKKIKKRTPRHKCTLQRTPSTVVQPIEHIFPRLFSTWYNSVLKKNSINRHFSPSGAPVRVQMSIEVKENSRNKLLCKRQILFHLNLLKNNSTLNINSWHTVGAGEYGRQTF